MVLVGGDTRRSAVRGEVKPAVATHVDATVDFPRHVVTLRKRQCLLDVNERAHLERLRVEFKDERVARWRKVIADRRVVLTVDREGVPPD